MASGCFILLLLPFGPPRRPDYPDPDRSQTRQLVLAVRLVSPRRATCLKLAHFGFVDLLKPLQHVEDARLDSFCRQCAPCGVCAEGQLDLPTGQRQGMAGKGSCETQKHGGRESSRLVSTGFPILAMKHGIAFRKLSRTSSHRMLMLRNLVTSLFEHEQIKTTLPKAREAARLAEKVCISWIYSTLFSR